jgi:methyltransferase (TIGR00027 family)
MDVPITQAAKTGQYKKRNLAIPSNLIFIPVDFERESMQEKLDSSGFKKSARTFFLLEGLLMYLEPCAVDNLFSLIREYGAKGSRIVFDYIYASVLRKEELYYGESSIYKMVSGAAEQWHFGIEKNGLGEFLAAYEMRVIEHLDSFGLEQRYFREPDGRIAGRINGTHCVALAERN